jgi:hypothetical protein
VVSWGPRILAFDYSLNATNFDMPSTITNEDELAASLDNFWRGADRDLRERDYFIAFLGHGRNFVCSADGLRMAPSRFVGYRGNTLGRHAHRDRGNGGATDQAITRILGEPKSDRAMEAAYRRLCSSFEITPSRRSRKYWRLVATATVVGAMAPRPVGERGSLTARLKLPIEHEVRLRAIAATTASVVQSLRPEWYRVRLNRPTHLRIFCGRLIVASLEGNYVWLALDEKAIGANALEFHSWSWDDARSRPDDAKGQPYPRYARPPSRNGFYDPRKDPTGTEWRKLEPAHHQFLRHAATVGRAPDHRTRIDPDLADEIARWMTADAGAALFESQVRAALELSPSERRARLGRPQKPEVRRQTVEVFVRNVYVVAEVLERAGGECELCGKPAPFLRATDGRPYLEVHHRVRLADGGDDTVENALALCPNCHREQHFG